MSDVGNGPPTFPESDKFDGSNWTSFKNMIVISVHIHGVMGYLDGSTHDPSTQPKAQATATTTTTTTTTETRWYSNSPSPDEWQVRNAWTKGLLLYNIRNPIGLGANIAGTAADLWSSLTSLYDAESSALALLYAEEQLRNLRLRDGDIFPNHLAQLRTLRQNINAMGGQINDLSFRSIVLSSLPQSWDSVVAKLYTTTSSVDAIAQLNAHWTQISNGQQHPVSSNSPIASYANTTARRSNLVCNNQNCRRPGHSIEDCYWPGGGKEGQFPPNFGRHRMQGQNPQSHQPQQTTQGQSMNQKRRAGQSQRARSVNTIADEATAVNDRTVVESTRDVVVPMTEVGELMEVEGSVSTVANSGATDHCFVKRADFIKYTQLLPPLVGKAAEKETSFVIAGKGDVKITVGVEGRTADLVLRDVLHTPGLRYNLVSISSICDHGMNATFGPEGVTISYPDGQMAARGRLVNGLYIIDAVDPPQVSHSF